MFEIGYWLLVIDYWLLKPTSNINFQCSMLNVQLIFCTFAAQKYKNISTYETC